MLLKLFFAFFLSSNIWASSIEAEKLVLHLETVDFSTAGEKIFVTINGRASPSLKIYLKSIEVASSAKNIESLSAKVETSLGVKTNGTRLEVPQGIDEKLSFTAELPKSFVKIVFEVEHQRGDVLGVHTLSFGVMDTALTLKLNSFREFENPVPVVPEKEPEYRASGFSVWAGTGFNYMNYKQHIGTLGSFDDHAISGLNLNFEAKYRHENGFGGLISYRYVPSKIRLEQTNVWGFDHDWTSMSADGFYEIKSPSPFWGGDLFYGLRIGMQDHRFSYIHQANVGELSVEEVSLRTASMGFLSRVQKGRTAFHWTMRYQYPLSAKADGLMNFDISPQFAFDGSVGATYLFKKRWMLGGFWSGQWHEHNLKFMVNDKAYNGSQTLFYSTMELMLGVEF